MPWCFRGRGTGKNRRYGRRYFRGEKTLSLPIRKRRQILWPLEVDALAVGRYCPRLPQRGTGAGFARLKAIKENRSDTGTARCSGVPAESIKKPLKSVSVKSILIRSSVRLLPVPLKGFWRKILTKLTRVKF